MANQKDKNNARPKHDVKKGLPTQAPGQTNSYPNA
jgi:hypothetical protein